MVETAQTVVITAQRGLSNCAAAHARSLEGTLVAGQTRRDVRITIMGETIYSIKTKNGYEI